MSTREPVRWATILINASNIHVGGGLQVATSLIDELSRQDWPDLKIAVAASTEVDNSLRTTGFARERFQDYRILNAKGFQLWNRALSSMIDSSDATITVFGPLYLAKKPRRSVVGFAQAWILYPDNEAYRLLPFGSRMQSRLFYAIKALFFRKNTDVMIAEAPHVAEAWIRLAPRFRGRIRVVPNGLNAVFVKYDVRSEPSLRSDRPLRLGYLGRNYKHKNLAILPAVGRILAERHGLDVEFHVTFTDSEWAGVSDAFRAMARNRGSIPINHCPAFYESVDGVIFPSLLECFSATPLEAMSMLRPLFASDRPFVRDVCGDFPFYFDPLSPENVAAAIVNGVNEGLEARRHRLAAARAHALGWPPARARAQGYIDTVRELLGRSGQTGRAS